MVKKLKSTYNHSNIFNITTITHRRLIFSVDQLCCQTVCVQCRPEYVGMSEAVHQLYLLQHVGFVTGHGVHLQSHHLPRGTMLHLQRKRERKYLSQRHFRAVFMSGPAGQRSLALFSHTHTHTLPIHPRLQSPWLQETYSGGNTVESILKMWNLKLTSFKLKFSKQS